MEFTFNDKPVAKQRPRFGDKGKVYDPQHKKYLEYKCDAANQIRSQGSERPLEDAISVNMTFHMPMPKKWPQKRKEEQLGKPMTSKPDVDNLMKWILDVLSGIAYKDDRFVTSGCFQKVWGYEGKVEVSIYEDKVSLIDEISILGNSAVKMHLILSEIYEFSLHSKRSKFKDFVVEKCLEAGLDEIKFVEVK